MSILPVLVNGIASPPPGIRAANPNQFGHVAAGREVIVTYACKKLRNIFFYHTTTQPVILPWDNYIVSAGSTYECTASYQMHAMPKPFVLVP